MCENIRQYTFLCTKFEFSSLIFLLLFVLNQPIVVFIPYYLTLFF